MSKRSQTWLLVGLILVLALSVAGCSSGAKEAVSEPPQSEAAPSETAPAQETPPAAAEGETEQVAELVIEDEVVGKGAEAKSGGTVTVHYTGWLTDGTKFDSSRDSGQPFQFGLGQGQVIAGWDQGVVGMKVGGKRKLTIPPDLGYGAQGSGPVPPNATMVFDVELLSVE